MNAEQIHVKISYSVSGGGYSIESEVFENQKEYDDFIKKANSNHALKKIVGIFEEKEKL